MEVSSSLVDNSEALTSVFGYWPSFHDAEVVELKLRRAPPGDYGPTLDVSVHVFEMTKEITASGRFLCRKHSLVELRFRNIEGLQLEDFNHQNALQFLSIAKTEAIDGASQEFEVSFESAYGLGCDFKCRHIEVVSVASGIPSQSVYLPKG